jgi:phytoene dehydrogenase-like protein
VLEAGATVGGGARTQELTRPGVLHDVCSAIHPLGVGSPFFSGLPLEQHGLEWIHPTVPLAHPLDDGTAAVLARELEETEESFRYAPDAKAYRKLFRTLTDWWTHLAPDLLAPPHFPGKPGLFARFSRHAVRSASGLAEKQFGGVRARALFAGNAAHSVLPLTQRASAAVGLVLQISGHAVGWPMPRGGSQQISNALASFLTHLGGEIVTNHPVKSLDEMPTARAYLFDTSPSQLLQMVGEEQLSPLYRRQLTNYRHGPGIFKMDWALDGPIPWQAEACRGAGTVHVGGTLNEITEAEATVWRGAHPEKPFVLVAQQSLFDPTRAPANKHTGWAYCHVPSGSTVDMTDRIEAQIERFAPGFRDLILERHTMNTEAMQEYNRNYIGGDITGGVASLRQLVGRPALRRRSYVTSDPRLLLCSASTPPGAGVHGMCGYHAAMTALRNTLRD